MPTVLRVGWKLLMETVFPDFFPKIVLISIKNPKAIDIKINYCYNKIFCFRKVHNFILEIQHKIVFNFIFSIKSLLWYNQEIFQKTKMSSFSQYLVAAAHNDIQDFHKNN